jgi:glycosyltransferase involved in cell wall biosynthesis
MTGRKRVGLYLRSRPSDGGVFQYAISVLRAMSNLPADRFDVVVAYTQPELEPYVSAHGTEAHHIYFPRRLENWIGLVSSALVAAGLPIPTLRAAGRLEPLARRLAAIDCDLWVFPAGDSVIYRADVRSIAVIHDLMHRYEPRFPEVGRWTIRTRRELHYRALCASADRLIADSELGARHIAESYHVDNARISVLPYSAPDDRSAPSTATLDMPDLPESYFYYPAHFWPHKNHLNLARAVRLLVDRGLDPHVVLSGGATGNHREFADLVARLKITGRFTDLGHVSADLVAALYAGSVALVYPSYFGPTNIPPLEALVHETPMAVSDNYAMREQLADAALYFDPDSPTSIADSMAELLEAPARRRALVGAGRKIVDRYRPSAFDANVRRIIEAAFLASGVRQHGGARTHVSSQHS